MAERQFNLTTDPWIKVFDSRTNREDEVSMIEFFQDTQNYRAFTGEMQSQDVSTMRFLLAVLTTVYSRRDADGAAYPWAGADDTSAALKQWPLDQRNQALLETWRKLYDAGQFSAAVTDYLKEHSDDFNFFGERPFYQATATEYDSLVPPAKSIEKGKGIVRARQLNRSISESGNSPMIFSPKSESFKDQMEVNELVRWIIMYQNYTGVTDKTKIVVPKNEVFRSNAGWLYKIDPVFAKGYTLFDTLLANLILTAPIDGSDQHPVWEWPTLKDYVNHQRQKEAPTNLAELYTVWSRVLHIEWSASDRPVIYAANIPMFDNVDAFVEPMTAWHFSEKYEGMKPNRKAMVLSRLPMWMDTSEYFVKDEKNVSQRPGIIKWLQILNDKDFLAPGLRLTNISLISEDNQSSQAPADEVRENIPVELPVLFDKQILSTVQEAIAITLKIRSFYFHLVYEIAEYRGVKPTQISGRFESKLLVGIDKPFRNWLSSLSPQDDLDEKLDDWRNELKTIVKRIVKDIVRSSSPQERKGRPDRDDNGVKFVRNLVSSQARLYYLMGCVMKESREGKIFRK